MKLIFPSIVVVGLVFQAQASIPQAARGTELPYHSLTDEDRDRTVFIPEGCYALITKDSNIQSAIVGPTCPCIMVAAYEFDRDAAVVIHAKIKTDPKVVARIINKYLGSSLDKLVLYSRDGEVHIKESNPGFTTEEIAEIVSESSVPSVEQRNRFFNLKNQLESAFNLDRSQIRMIYNDIPADATMEFRRLAASTVFITKELRPHGLCQITERIFAAEDETPTPLVFTSDVLEKNARARACIHDRLVDAALKAGCIKDKKQYVRIPDDLAGLEKITKPVHNE